MEVGKFQLWRLGTNSMAGIRSVGSAVTPRKFNSSPLKIGLPKRKFIFQTLIFRGELLVSGRIAVAFLQSATVVSLQFD